MNDHFRFTVRSCECRICGVESPFHSAVAGAEGVYCGLHRQRAIIGARERENHRIVLVTRAMKQKPRPGYEHHISMRSMPPWPIPYDEHTLLQITYKPLPGFRAMLKRTWARITEHPK